MHNRYFVVNIRAYLDQDGSSYIGEKNLSDLLSDFSCPQNPDVEYFLLHNAIEFTKKDQLDLRQYLRHKKLNIFSPCLNIGNYVYYAARASSSTCCGVL